MLAARHSRSKFSRCPTIMPVPASHCRSAPASGRRLLAGFGFCCRCLSPEALDYLAPEGTSPPEPGSFVSVPLGQRSLTGVVWDGVGDELPEERLKPIIEMLPTPRLQPELRRFVERVAAYTMAPPGSVLRMTMSVPEALQPPRPRRLCAASPTGAAALGGATTETRLTPARRRVLEVLCDGPPMPAAELARLAGCGTGVVRDLIAAGLVEERFASAEAPELRSPDWRLCGPALSPDQSIAAQRLVNSVEAGAFRVTVLDGVTGSGKTETYFAALAAALAADGRCWCCCRRSPSAHNGWSGFASASGRSPRSGIPT